MRNTSDSNVHCTDRDVLKAAGDPEAHIIIRHARLRYLLRLFRHGPLTLVRMLVLMVNVPKSWAGLVVQDFKFL